MLEYAYRRERVGLLWPEDWKFLLFFFFLSPLVLFFLSLLCHPSLVEKKVARQHKRTGSSYLSHALLSTIDSRFVSQRALRFNRMEAQGLYFLFYLLYFSLIPPLSPIQMPGKYISSILGRRDVMMR